MQKIHMLRNRRLGQQKWKCHYCGQPMWQRNLSAFAARYGLDEDKAAFFQATAEHLVPRSEGGANTLRNIVAACLFCNSRRHFAKAPLSHEAFREEVRVQMSKGEWHGFVARDELS